jgi:hypothetical protein
MNAKEAKVKEHISLGRSISMERNTRKPHQDVDTGQVSAMQEQKTRIRHIRTVGRMIFT